MKQILEEIREGVKCTSAEQFRRKYDVIIERTLVYVRHSSGKGIKSVMAVITRLPPLQYDSALLM